MTLQIVPHSTRNTLVRVYVRETEICSNDLLYIGLSPKVKILSHYFIRILFLLLEKHAETYIYPRNTMVFKQLSIRSQEQKYF
jgi:hypothetical protein